MDDVLKMLDELEEILEESRSVPFSNKVSISKEEFFEIIGEIRSHLPNEIKQSKWILEERNKILLDAQKEADEIIRNAEEYVNKLVDEHEVTKRAYAQADGIIENGQKTAKALRVGSLEYADGIIADLELQMKQIQDMVQKESIRLNEFFNERLDVLYDNRRELKGIKKD
ncbi:MAG: ATPase [Firmicutes bacterium]|nr:ATPase [Bacillota bacterium]